MLSSEKIAPVSKGERIISLDILRGIAILGILIMNVQSFSMIQAAYINPTAFGDFTGLNRWVWIFSHVFADEKFMALFSMLFGAGIVLITQKATFKGIPAASLHYRRIFWLLLIGLIHAYVFWYGDILVPYALCAVPAFLFRKLKPAPLLIIGLLLISIASLIYLFFGFTIPFWPAESVQNTMRSWNPNMAAASIEINALRGGFMTQLSWRIPAAIYLQTFVFLIMNGWRIGGLMLMGMAFYKWGIFNAARSSKFYTNGMIIGFVVGFLMIGYGVLQDFRHQFSLEHSMFLGAQYNYWGSLFLAFAYICLTMLLYQKNRIKKIFRKFAALGQTALSNYLLQTVIFTFIFYGHGLGLFGQVERKFQILMVLVMWVVQLYISEKWLQHFRFGPAEWMWRSLTYWRFQPMKKEDSDS